MPLTPRRAVFPLPTVAVLTGATIVASLVAAGCNDFTNKTAPPVCPDSNDHAFWANGDTIHAAMLSESPDASCWSMIDGLDVPLNAAMGSAGIGDDSFLMHGAVSPQNVTAKVKAIYTPGTTLDNSYLYLQISWADNSHDAGGGTWHFGSPGSTDPMAPAGWSQWGTDDKVAIMWPIDAKADTAFTATGCAYACHTASPMKPTTGATDVWYWKAGGTNPIAYAEDWYASSTVSLAPDTDKFIASAPGDVPNLAAGGGAAVVKKLNQYMVYRPFGQDSTVLDSTLYVLATASQPLEGRVTLGDSIYTQGVTTAGIQACAACHQANGKGVANHDLTTVGRSWSLDKFARYQSRPDSTGHPDFRSLSVAEQRGLLARLRAFINIPRRTINRPTGSAGDLRVDNWNATYENGTYTVVLKRKLSTGFDADRILAPGKTHPFALAVMNRDSSNHSGSKVYYLDFRQPPQQ